MTQWTLADSAKTMLDVRETAGARHNPIVVGMLQAFASWIQDDETAWCGAFAGFICKVNGYPTPGPKPWHALRARYWLTVGVDIPLERATGNCVVIFKRGGGNQPGPETLDATGHVAFFNGYDGGSRVSVVGGNQSNKVSVTTYPTSRVLGVRRMVRSPR